MKTVQEFAASIKAKYPVYKDIDDRDLVERIVAKYPQYREHVDLSESPAFLNSSPVPGVPGMGGENIAPERPKPQGNTVRKSDASMGARAFLPTTLGDQEERSQPLYDADGNIRGYVQVGGAGPMDVVGDALGTGTRALGSLAGKLGYDGATGGDKGFVEGMADAQTGLARPLREGATRAGDNMLAKTENRIGRGMIHAGKAVAVGALAFAEDPTTPLTLGAGAIAKTASKFAPQLRQAGRAVAQAPNKLAGMAAEELSGVSEEALRRASTKTGRKSLEEAAGRQSEIGDQLLDRIDNFDDYIPERQAIDDILQQMPDMDLGSAIKALENAKVKPEAGRLFPNEIAANAKIDTYIDALRGGTPPEDLARIAQQERARARMAGVKVDALDQEVKAAGKDLKQAERGQKEALSQVGKTANDIKFYKKNETDFGWWYEEARQKAKDAARQAREASDNLEASTAVKGVKSGELESAKAAAEAAERNFAVTDAAAQIYGGAPLKDAAKTLSSVHGLKGDALRDALAKARNRAASQPAPLDLNVKASEYRNLRKKLDVNIDFNTEEGKLVNEALKAGRGTMKDQLIAAADASGNPEYAKQMRAWSDKLDKLERIKRIVGKTGVDREKRIESFISNLFGKNSEYKQELMRDLDKIFGSNMTGEARDAFLAAQLGEGGKATLFPRQFTGRSMLGMVAAPGVSIPFASPALATRLTLPMTQALENVMLKTGGKLSSRGMSALKALEKAKAPVTQARLIQIIEREAGMPGNVVPFRPRKVAEQDEEDQRLSEAR